MYSCRFICFIRHCQKLISSNSIYYHKVKYFLYVLIFTIILFSCSKPDKYNGLWYLVNQLSEEGYITLDILPDNSIVFPTKEMKVIIVNIDDIDHIIESEVFIPVENENYNKGYINYKNKSIVIIHQTFEEKYSFIMNGDSMLTITSEKGDNYVFIHERAFSF